MLGLETKIRGLGLDIGLMATGLGLSVASCGRVQHHCHLFLTPFTTIEAIVHISGVLVPILMRFNVVGAEFYLSLDDM